MNLQAAFEATGQTETGAETRRGWSIEELREKLGLVGAEKSAEPAAPKQGDEVGRIRPRIVRRGVEQAAA